VRLAFALTLVLLTAACRDSSAPTADANAVANEVIVETEGGEEVTADNEAMPPFAEVNGAHPTAPEPAPIPAKFRGTWAESKKACTALNHPSRLTISGKTVRTPSTVLVGDSFTFPTPNQFALDGKFEGSERAGAAHYSLDATGNILTDEAGGGAVRVRCA
jgi:hypothetical protein